MSKPDHPSQEDLELHARMFKALSNPHRLRILLDLARCAPPEGLFESTEEEAENCQREFASTLGLAQSTISHHFKELRNAGLLGMRREGKSIFVWVDSQALASIRHLLEL